MANRFQTDYACTESFWLVLILVVSGNSQVCPQMIDLFCPGRMVSCKRYKCYVPSNILQVRFLFHYLCFGKKKGHWTESLLQ